MSLHKSASCKSIFAILLVGAMLVFAGCSSTSNVGTTTTTTSSSSTTTFSSTPLKVGILSVNGKDFNIEKAITQQEKIQGLSGRDSLEKDSGLLFFFDTGQETGIWMKDMKFAIDIIWIDVNQEIVHIESDISPDTYPEIFDSPEPARYVLEINAGQAKEASMSVGDKVEFDSSVTS